MNTKQLLMIAIILLAMILGYLIYDATEEDDLGDHLQDVGNELEETVDNVGNELKEIEESN